MNVPKGNAGFKNSRHFFQVFSISLALFSPLPAVEGIFF
jgi:hypothetical protein